MCEFAATTVGKPVQPIEGNVWGVQWLANAPSPEGTFPQYYKQVGEERVVMDPAEVPVETRWPDHRSF